MCIIHPCRLRGEWEQIHVLTCQYDVCSGSVLTSQYYIRDLPRRLLLMLLMLQLLLLLMLLLVVVGRQLLLMLLLRHWPHTGGRWCVRVVRRHGGLFRRCGYTLWRGGVWRRRVVLRCRGRRSVLLVVWLRGLRRVGAEVLMRMYTVMWDSRLGSSSTGLGIHLVVQVVQIAICGGCWWCCYLLLACCILL